jgi:hypothetical protein
MFVSVILLFTPFNLLITDLYNHKIAVGDCSDTTKVIYRLQSNSCQITSKYTDPSGSAFTPFYISNVDFYVII